MKTAFAIALGVVIGLVLPFACGRELRVNVIHEFKLPLKGATK